MDVVSPTQITCTLPISGAIAGSWDVTVLNPDTGADTLAGGFTITAPPTVTSITPSSGLNTGDVAVTNLAGTGFSVRCNSNALFVR